MLILFDDSSNYTKATKSFDVLFTLPQIKTKIAPFYRGELVSENLAEDAGFEPALFFPSFAAEPLHSGVK
jgi:hypothetical protein